MSIPSHQPSGAGTVAATWRALRAEFHAAGLEEAPTLADWLVSGVLGCRRTELILHVERRLRAATARRLRGLARRVLTGEPLQYVLGCVEFQGCMLRADRRALIPRPETEQLVDLVLADAELGAAAAPRLADVGTGSGCIAIALALRWPHAVLEATDRSAAALALARANARRMGVAWRIVFRQADLLGRATPGAYDALVSNPPYVASAEWRSLPPLVRDHEPRAALDGGADGLRVIARLARQARTALRSGGCLFLEIGEDQAGRVKKMLAAEGFRRVSSAHDWAGHERLVRAVKP